MASSGATPAPAPSNNAQVATAIAVLNARTRSGGNWFMVVAALSVVNAVLMAMGGNVRFIVGLGITDLVEAVAKGPAQGNATATVAAFVVDAFIAGIFMLFGVMAKKGQGWAFLVGMVLYALDGVLLLLIQDFFSAAFHAYALFCIFKGYQALQQLRKVQAAQAAAAAGYSTGPKPIG